MLRHSKNTLVIVLGMHRSGTSAITRALQVFGIQLGNDLIPPLPDVNDKGFWEDIDINALNIEMLNFFGIDWHSLQPISEDGFKHLLDSHFFSDASSLLKRKTSMYPYFGFKDPRIAKLLPFWKEVFKKSGMQVKYVIALRNPLSVCKSLQKRDGFDHRKSYLLWQEHIINSLLETIGESRIIVEYDRLMSSPESELRRVSNAFNLEFIQNEFDLFAQDFLDRDLCHSTYTLDDVLSDDDAPILTKEIYSNLLDYSSEGTILKDNSMHDMSKLWATEHSRQLPLFKLIDDLDLQNRKTVASLELLTQTMNNISQLDSESEYTIEAILLSTLKSLTEAEREKNSQWLTFSKQEFKMLQNHAYEERKLQESLLESYQNLKKVDQHWASRLNSELAGLTHEKEDLQNQVAQLRQAVQQSTDKARDEKLNYEKLRANFQSELDQKKSLVEQYRSENKQLSITLESISSSNCWKLFSPLHKLERLLCPVEGNSLHNHSLSADNELTYNNTSESIYSLSDLLALDGEDLVISTYQSILHRNPDKNGLNHYVAALTKGTSKLEIIWNIYTSPEGKSKKPDLPGLDEIGKWIGASRLPVIGHAIKILINYKLNVFEINHLKKQFSAVRTRKRTLLNDLHNFVNFDPDLYLAVNDDVAASGINPYEHYIKYGYRENRQFKSISHDKKVLYCDWLAGTHKEFKPKKTTTVDIVIPIYNGYELLTPLFESIVANTGTGYRVIVINDCSTDEKINGIIDLYKNKFSDCIVLNNLVNEGFISSVNKAVSCVTSDFFVLLNSDTEVPSGWLERIVQPLLSDNTVASVTPFSNAATICSFPVFLNDNTMFLGLPASEIDKAFSKIHPLNPLVNLPTAVGFCMAIRKSVVDEIGMFDPIYGRGYCEENDWCMRAAKAGYRHVLANNLFVYHKHGGTFTNDEKRRLIEANQSVLSERYPDYNNLVQDHISQNPAEAIREFVKLQLISDVSGGSTIIIDHNFGGGANSYRKQLVRSKLNEVKSVLLILVASNHKNDAIELVAFTHEDSHQFNVPTLEALRKFLRQIKIREIIYNNLVGFNDSLKAVRTLRKYIKNNPAPLTVLIHDFYPVCPSYTLLNNQGRYCEVPDSMAVCDMCLNNIPQHISSFIPDSVKISAWRHEWLELMRCAQEVRCFSQSSREIVAKAYPQISSKLTIVPHSVDFKPKKLPAINFTSPFHIGVVGGINYAKGRGVLESLSNHIEKNNLNYKITVIGELDVPVSNVFVTGRYDVDNLAKIIENNSINYIFIPSVWPETFSYVTSEIIALGMPISCFDLGAPSERIKEYPYGLVLNSFEPEYIVNQLFNHFLEIEKSHSTEYLRHSIT